MKRGSNKGRNSRRHITPQAINNLDAAIEKLQYDGDYYDNRDITPMDANTQGQEGVDWVWGMKGSDGNFYDMEESSQYDKDFFTGRPVRLSLANRLRRFARPTRQTISIPARTHKPMPMIRPFNPESSTILPTKPENRPATDAEIAGSDQFDVKVTKTVVGAQIAADLPFILFSPVFRETNYVTLIPTIDLPSGTTVAVQNSGNGGVDFIYTNGANVTTLTITSDTTPYRAILQALMVDRFNVVRTRESISDTTTISQTNLSLSVSNGSLFGGQSFNKLSAIATKGPDQFQNGIIDFDSLYPLDKFRAVQGFMSSSAPTGFSASFSFWAGHVKKN